MQSNLLLLLPDFLPQNASNFLQHYYGVPPTTPARNNDILAGLTLLLYLTLFYFWASTLTDVVQLGLAKAGYSLGTTPIRAPFDLPLIGHALSLGTLPKHFVFLLRTFCEGIPVQVNLVVDKPIFLSSHQHAELIFKSSSRLNSKPYVTHLMQIFGHPPSFHALIAADTSDLSRKAHSEADARLESRYENVTFSQISRSCTGVPLSIHMQKFNHHLSTGIAKYSSESWISGDSLESFIYRRIFPALMGSLFGKRLLDVSPNFQESFREFDCHFAKIARHVPSWWDSRPYKAREACVQAIKEWKRTLPSPGSCKESPEKYIGELGSQLALQRHLLFADLEAMTEEAIACEELAFIWGATSNTIHTAFWFILELLQSPDALLRFRQCLVQCEYSRDNTGLQVWDCQQLSQQAWIQSYYSEICRRYISAFILRSTTKPLQIGQWKIPVGQTIMLNVAGHKRDAATLPTPSDSPEHALSKCWPERYLVGEPGREAFKPASTAWSGFGGGANMCPGRFFAKQQILSAASYLLGNLDFELVGQSNARPDWAGYGLGSIGAKGEQGFRVRLRSKDSALA